jgi:CRP-like cAMP-binding protein
METGALGKMYQPGEVIIRQGEVADCMYVIQEGQVEVVIEQDGQEVQLAVENAGQFFGEMAIFEHQVRNATVRALTPVRALTVDKTNFLRRVHEDPSLAYHVVQVMSHRIRELDAEVARLKATKLDSLHNDQNGTVSHDQSWCNFIKLPHCASSFTMQPLYWKNS